MRIARTLATLAVIAASASAPTAQQPPVFRARTTLIEVDAIVKDGKGQFVPDLSAGDFAVIEDGVPQTIEAFYVVTRGGVSAAAVPPVPLESPVRPLVPPAPTPPKTERVFVLFFDLEHMTPGNVDRAKKAAAVFLAKDFQAGDVGGVVAGGGMVHNRLTSSREELEAAVGSVMPTDASRSRQIEMREWPRLADPFEAYLVGDRQDREAISRAVQRACADDASACKGGMAEQQVMEKARRMVVEYRVGGQRTMHSISALATGLARLPGRKTIIFLSDGFFTEDAWANLRRATDLAAKASVRVYALDTRGLNRGSASSDIFEQGPHSSVNPAGDVAGFDTAADGPNSLAVDTGGLMIRNENDFGRALHEIAEDTSSYYILGYRPANTTFDGKFRDIKVSVKRPGLRVRARKGYLATADRLQAAPQPETAPVPATEPPPPPVAATTTTPTRPPLPAPKPTEATAAAVPTPKSEPAKETPTASPLNAPAAGGAAAMAVRVKPPIGERVSELTSMAASPGGAPLPESVIRQARDGWEAYQRGDVEGARTRLSAAAVHPSSPPWVRYALGWSEYALADFPAAGREWEQVKAAVPQFQAVYFDLADAYLQQREFGKSVAVLREAEKRWPTDVEVYNALGVIQAGRGAMKEAAETFEKGVSLQPGDATACYNLAKTSELLYIQAQRLRRNSSTQSMAEIMRDRDRALEYYRRTVELGGSLAEAAKEGLKRLGGQ